MGLAPGPRDKTIPTGLRLGAWLVVISGLFPTLLATVNYVRLSVSVTNPDQPWTARMFAPATYSLNAIRGFSTQLASDYVLACHVQFTNLLTTGVMIILIGVFGIRQGLKWAWFLMVFIGLWAGLNDLLAFVNARVFALPVIPEVIGLVGLAVARPATFPRGRDSGA